MPINSRWWKRGKRERACEGCGTRGLCFEFQGDGSSPCGYRVLCEICYEEHVPRVHHSGVTRRTWFKQVYLVISGVCLGAGGGYLLTREVYRHRKIRVVTGAERAALVAWAMGKAENVSASVVGQMVAEACRSEFPPLIVAIICAESRFNPGAVSSAGCWGPMQVNPKVWPKELREQGIIAEPSDLFDPVLGVRAGVYIFCKYLEEAGGNLRVATRRYVGALHNIKDAGAYFDGVQRYLGEIYLALYREGKKNGPAKGDDQSDRKKAVGQSEEADD